jgi:DNA-binding MarR family transcriptional regulator
MAHSSARGEDETLSEAFWSVARQLRRRSRERLTPWDINPSHARVLGVLRRHGVLRLSELSEHLRIAPRSTTEVVDALEHRGLLERRPDPQDRRATLVALTAEGTKVDAAIDAARAADGESFFGVLSAADRTRLHRILQTLREVET